MSDGRTAIPSVVQIVTRLDNGGAQRVVLDLCRHAVWPVHLIAGAGGFLDGHARELAGRHGFSLRLLPGFRHDIEPRHEPGALLEMAGLLRRLKRAAPGRLIVHTHSPKASLMGAVAARLAGVPHIVHTVHGFMLRPFHRQPKRGMIIATELLTCRLSSVNIAVSKANYDEGRGYGFFRDGRDRLIHNGIDTGRLTGLPLRSPEAGRPVEVVSVANFKAQKDWQTFARAAALVLNRHPATTFTYWGEGPHREEFLRLAGELGCGGRVAAPGWCRSVPDVLGRADLFLFTTHHEGHPLSVVEATIAGLPVVATRIDGIPEVVDEGVTGFTVPYRDPEAAAERVCRLIDDPGLRGRMAEAGRATAERWGVGRMVAAYGEVYRRLASG